MKHLTLDYWMNKLGYRRTHWSDDVGRIFVNGYLEAKNGKKVCFVDGEHGEYLVTLSVKKMK